ncbi:MAG: hypothetical protein M1570_18320 [Chloroflexi bacterium]|nr:hypothetical protein [Chloroflexota bacterium]
MPYYRRHRRSTDSVLSLFIDLVSLPLLGILVLGSIWVLSQPGTWGMLPLTRPTPTPATLQVVTTAPTGTNAISSPSILAILIGGAGLFAAGVVWLAKRARAQRQPSASLSPSARVLESPPPQTAPSTPNESTQAKSANDLRAIDSNAAQSINFQPAGPKDKRVE